GHPGGRPDRGRYPGLRQDAADTDPVLGRTARRDRSAAAGDHGRPLGDARLRRGRPVRRAAPAPGHGEDLSRGLPRDQRRVPRGDRRRRRRVREGSPLMPRDPKRRTVTEDARRAQLIGVTIDLVARHGYAGCSLQRIAAAAGITKAAVIYHFASKNEVIRAAYETVLTDMVDHVTERVEAADSPVAAVEAYLAAMIDYAGRHPNRIRMLIEAMVAGDETGVTDRPTSPDRARGLATLIRAAQADGGYRADVDADGLAL